jgi:Ferritin-like
MIRIRPDVSGLLQARDTNAVAAALQAALELEHATIPPYLYAMYSLGSGANSAVADIIRSVVTEEMLHLTLVANILNALGGTPVFDSPTLIPSYPGPLPGSVEHDLVVGLAPFSVDLAENTFMAIEQPEDPLAFHAAAVALDEPITIGQFYRAIRATIVDLGDGAFASQPRNQITPDQMDGAVVVTDVATASQAIDTIIDQGEGTASTPSEVSGTDYAHYYRFAEIVHGRRLIPNPAAGPSTPPDQQFIYGGDPIPFAPAEVFAVPVNPTTTTYPVDTAARKACVTFNFTYTSLLKTLQIAFTGQPDQIGPAIGIMFSLQGQAMDMMAGTTTTGVPAGPTFEWQPVNV